ncbi:MAG: pyruvate kinase, partial [Clostridia bacterium]|nr:pyruvate kinase [Clostridia bacterium]
MRKTKIVCTIGPACTNEAILEKMCLAGMNVARLNFSHGTYDDHKQRIDMIKSVRERLGMPIGIMLDTKGPEYRIGVFANGSEELEQGAEFTFTPDDILGDKNRVSVSYKSLAAELYVGDNILVNNGLLVFKVKEIKGGDVVCEVLNSGKISDR